MDTDEVRLEGRKLAGRYALEEEVASGGMGALWRARDEVLGRTVAVKILHDRLARDPDLLERFRHEAVAAARLSHPNVVRVFDTGVDEGICFIVMELVEGQTFEDILRDRGPLPPEEAAAIVRGVLLGLAHAHREGVVHRDVKPANVLVDRSGLVKVTDFGIAKAAFTEEDLTTTGSLLGTARYLAPEQVSGDPIDGRSDIYSAGVVLYEALTGRPPFEADSHIATATMRMAKDPAPPRAIRPGIPRPLDALVMRAMARNPDERFQTAEEMASAIDRGGPVAEAPPPQPVAAPAPHPQPARGVFRSWMAIPLVLLLVAAAAVGAFILLEGLPGGDEANRRGDQAARGETLEIVEADAHDPLGDDIESDDDIPAVFDGDRESAWTTERYEQEDLGGLKDGVGVVLDLGDSAEIASVRIRTDLPGWRFELFASDDPEPLDDEQLTADGEESFDTSATTTVDLDEPVQAQYLLVWITLLTESEDGFRGQINEVDVFGAGG